jgi:hypothetical protein
MRRPAASCHAPRNDPQAWAVRDVSGRAGFSLFNFALYGALNFTSALNVSIEQSAFPSVVMLSDVYHLSRAHQHASGVGVLLTSCRHRW